MSQDQEQISVATQCAELYEAIEGRNGNSNGNGSTIDIDPFVTLLSSTNERSKLVACIQSSKFHKNHARRIFSAIGPLLQDVIEQEAYVPASAFDDEEEERRSSHDHSEAIGNGGNSGNVDEPKSYQEETSMSRRSTGDRKSVV